MKCHQYTEMESIVSQLAISSLNIGQAESLLISPGLTSISTGKAWYGLVEPGQSLEEGWIPLDNSPVLQSGSWSGKISSLILGVGHQDR